jgi:hypothetical protein
MGHGEEQEAEPTHAAGRGVEPEGRRGSAMIAASDDEVDSDDNFRVDRSVAVLEAHLGISEFYLCGLCIWW